MLSIDLRESQAPAIRCLPRSCKGFSVRCISTLVLLELTHTHDHVYFASSTCRGHVSSGVILGCIALYLDSNREQASKSPLYFLCIVPQACWLTCSKHCVHVCMCACVRRCVRVICQLYQESVIVIERNGGYITSHLFAFTIVPMLVHLSSKQVSTTRELATTLLMKLSSFKSKQIEEYNEHTPCKQLHHPSFPAQQAAVDTLCIVFPMLSVRD